jgi:exonuclease III
MDVLNFTTFNSNGLGPGRKEYISELMTNSHFLLLQEHWLFEEQLHKLRGEIGENVNIHGISGMDGESLLVGRPYGGCAIAWDVNFEAIIAPVQWESKRVCAVTIKQELLLNDTLLINIYMPTDAPQNIREYNSVLQEVSAILAANNATDIIIGGDLNTDLSRTGSAHTRALIHFLENENLICGKMHNISDVDYTYESKISGARSLIDHFIVSESVYNKIERYSVLHKGYCTSDHSSLHMATRVETQGRENSIENIEPVKALSWDRASLDDINRYEQTLSRKLISIPLPLEAINCRDYLCLNHTDEIEKFHDDIISACISAGEETIPFHKPSSVRGRAGWDNEINDLKRRAMFWHDMWKENGRPHNGVVADIRRHTRAKYHYAVRRLKKNQDKVAADKLAESLRGKNSTEFWKDIKKIKGSGSILPNTMDNVEGKEATCKLFAEKFKKQRLMIV